MEAAGKQEGEDKEHEEKERPRGPIVTNAERKRRKASPESRGQSGPQE